MKRRPASPALFALFICLFALVALPRAIAAPLATAYYSTGSVAPDVTGNWKTNRDGTGSSPANFTSGDVFVIQNGHAMTTSAVWSISGTGSKCICQTNSPCRARHGATAHEKRVVDSGGGCP